jgi:hypothetical protein
MDAKNHFATKQKNGFLILHGRETIKILSERRETSEKKTKYSEKNTRNTVRLLRDVNNSRTPTM